jgi:hypothetical protein
MQPIFSELKQLDEDREQAKPSPSWRAADVFIPMREACGAEAFLHGGWVV